MLEKSEGLQVKFSDGEISGLKIEKMEFYVGKYNIRESLALSIKRNRFAYKPRNPSLAMTADVSLPAAYGSTFAQSSDASEILLLRSNHPR